MAKKQKFFIVGIVIYVISIGLLVITLTLPLKSSLLISASGLLSIMGLSFMLSILSVPKLKEDREYFLRHYLVDAVRKNADVLLSFYDEKQEYCQEYFKNINFFDKFPESLDIGEIYVAKSFPTSIDFPGSSEEVLFNGRIMLVKKDDLIRFDKLKKATEEILAGQALKFMQEFPE
jgi:hypothetical protein